MKKLLPILLIAILVLIGIGLFSGGDSEAPADNGEAPQEEPANGEVSLENPTTYENESYDFAFTYPFDWNFEAAPEDELSPKFSAYIKPAGVPVTPPFDHFANISHVSVYPLGIPTEGVLGETAELDFNPPFSHSTESETYLLEDGTPFAAMIVPASPPESWNDSGFIWMRLMIDKLESECIDADGEEVSQEECDPLTKEHTIVRRGDVDTNVWETHKAIIDEFEFRK